MGEVVSLSKDREFARRRATVLLAGSALLGIAPAEVLLSAMSPELLSRFLKTAERRLKRGANGR